MAVPRQLLSVGEPCPDTLVEHLRQRDWCITQARTPKAARALLRQGGFKVALISLGVPTRDAFTDFEACREASDLCEWVAMLPPGALESALARDLVLRHCFDHHTHPVDPLFLCQSLGHAWGRAQLRERIAPVADETLGLIGRSAAMSQLRRSIRRAAAADACVLVEGESGTGKELVARALHDASPRAQAPFVTVNCGDLSDAPAKLFDSASGGTLFLDHVADMPLDWQARLVRFMAERGVLKAKLGRDCTDDVRFVAACDAPLEAAVAAKHFRQDLFFRLGVLPITVPPLRQRKEDIPLLAEHFHAQCMRTGPGATKGFSRQAMASMKDYAWPGNVRELANRIERATVLAQRRLIAPADLGLEEVAPQPIESLDAIRIQAERDAVALSLDRFSHNVSLAARELGVSRMTMYRLMAKHAIGTNRVMPDLIRHPSPGDRGA